MLMWIGTVIETIVSIFLTIFKTFYVVGRIIAYLSTLIADYLCSAYIVIADCAVILYEDVKTFAGDIDYQYSHFIRMLNNGFGNCIGDVLRFFDNIISSIVWIIEQFLSGTEKLLFQLNDLITNGAIGLRDWIILIGDSAWLLVTCVPNLTIFLLNRFIALIYAGTKNTFNASKTIGPIILNSIYDLISFFTSVPLQTIGGLIFLYIVAIYRHNLYKLLRISFRFLRQASFHWISRNAVLFHNVTMTIQDGLEYFTRWRNYLPSISLWPKLNSNRMDDNDDKDYEMSNCCIICQDELKSIVLMPCRHLCLCSNCYRRLRRYRRECPVCRQPFVQTIQVFT